MLGKYPKLESQLDAIFVDNMSNDFIEKTGAWPEAYFFADKDGKALWKSVIENDGTQSHSMALEVATKNGWVKK